MEFRCIGRHRFGQWAVRYSHHEHCGPLDYVVRHAVRRMCLEVTRPVLLQVKRDIVRARRGHPQGEWFTVPQFESQLTMIKLAGDE